MKPTTEQLLEALRAHVIYRTERDGRLVGRCCDLCGSRWKGLKEKHKPECILS